MNCKSFNFHYIDVLCNLYHSDGVHVSEDGKKVSVDAVIGELLCVQLRADR